MKKITVYPGDFALVVLGSTSTQLNAALKAWAAVVAREHSAWEAELTGDQWAFLADLFEQSSDTLPLEAADMNPCETIRKAIRDKHAMCPWVIESYTKTPKKMLDALDRMLHMRHGNYAAGWALKYAIDFGIKNAGNTHDWWRLDTRAKTPETS